MNATSFENGRTIYQYEIKSSSVGQLLCYNGNDEVDDNDLMPITNTCTANVQVALATVQL